MTIKPTPEVFIVGAGPVGAALAMKLSRAGVPVAGIHGRKAEQAASVGAMAGVLGTAGDYPHILSESDIVILAVPDREIPVVAKELGSQGLLAEGQVLLHCSGALAAEDALGPARKYVRGIGTIHPLISFADARLAAAALEGATIAVEGDAVGKEAARQLAARLSATVVMLEAKDMPLYHAAAVFACNYVVALVDAGVDLLGQVGFTKPQALAALIPLLGGTLRNLAEVGLPQALTGPVARGDAETVRRHLASLATSNPGLVNLYREAGGRALNIARELGRANADSLAALEPLLGGMVEAAGRTQASTGAAKAKRPALAIKKPAATPARRKRVAAVASSARMRPVKAGRPAAKKAAKRGDQLPVGRGRR